MRGIAAKGSDEGNTGQDVNKGSFLTSDQDNDAQTPDGVLMKNTLKKKFANAVRSMRGTKSE